MKKITLFLLSFLIISIASTQTAEIKLAKGQKFSIDNKVTAVTTQSLMGQSMESNAEIKTTSSIEVKDIKENNYNLVNTYTKMKAKVSAMGNDMDFDSDKKEDMSGKFAASFKDLIDKPKEVVMGKSGKILHLTKEETKQTDIQPDIMKMMIDQMLGDPAENGYGANIAFVPVPSNISAGYSWTDSSNTNGIQRITTYTVKGFRDKDAVVTIAGTLITDVKSKMHGMDIVTKSTGNLKGEEIVDITTGVIKDRTTTLETTGSIVLEAQGLDIPMTTKIIFTSSVKPA